MSEQVTMIEDNKDGMQYEQYGSVAEAIASCIFKALSSGRDISL